jgi:putative DNA primase/helicase
MAQSLKLVRYSTITPETNDWLWPGRIPLGKLTIIAGDPGVGKTWLTLDIASHVTTGKPFCDGTLPSKGEVIFITYEDGAGDTLLPRLEGLGANLGAIYHLEEVKMMDGSKEIFSLDNHLDVLEKTLESHPKIRMIVIDPINAAIAGQSNKKVREVMTPLKEMAERHDVAIVGITHLTKGSGKDLYRVLGSIGIVAAARAVWAVTAHPEDAKRRIFLPIKNNMAPAEPLMYRIIDGRVVWDGTDEAEEAIEGFIWDQFRPSKFLVICTGIVVALMFYTLFMAAFVWKTL